MALEPYQLFWLEDPVPAELQESLRLVRQHTLTPIAIGEVFNTLFDCQQLIAEQLIDYIRTAVAHAGGLTHLQRIAHFAELYHVRTACHGPTDLSPINLAATVHFQTAVHNFGLQEYMRHPDAGRGGVRRRLLAGGRDAAPRRAAGARRHFNEERAAEYPYRGPTCQSPAAATAACTAGECSEATCEQELAHNWPWTRCGQAVVARSGRRRLVSTCTPGPIVDETVILRR